MIRSAAYLLMGGLVVAGCEAPDPGAGGAASVVIVDTIRSTPPPADLVDPGIPPAIAGEDGWDYQLSAQADMDGDQRPEQVVLTARVEMYQGRPAWDDGQPWQVYVEDGDGTRTYLFAQRLQLGTLTMRIAPGTGSEPAAVLLLEHLPHRLSVYEATYRGPGDASVVVGFQREVDATGETASPQLP
jgi:hypothetical protein